MAIRVELKIPNHSAGVEALEAAVGQMALRAGFTAAVRDKLQTAAGAACRGALGQSADGEGSVSAVVERLADRIVVSLVYAGEAITPPAGQFDDVETSSQAGSSRTTLTKLFPQEAGSS